LTNKINKLIFLPAFLCMSLIMFFTSTFISAAFAEVGEDSLEGTVYYNIPLSGWTSMNQVEEGKAQLFINELTTNKDKLKFKGKLIYNGEENVINVNGQLKRSKQRSSDIIIDVESDNALQIAHFAVRFNSPEKKLIINKEMAGKDTLFLYLFDKKTNNLIMFECPISADILSQFKKVNVAELESSITDSWEHKVVNPKLKKIEDIDINAVYDSDTAYKQVQYDFGWGVAKHKTTVYLSSNAPTTIWGQAYVNSTLEIEQELWQPDGTYETGWSVIQIGRYDPVTVEYQLYSYNTANRDIISKKQYGGFWKGDSLPSLGVSVGYGFISGGISFNKQVAIDKNDFDNVWTVKDGTNFPYTTSAKFSDTYLTEEDLDHKYECNIEVTTHGDEGKKMVRSKWDVSFYDSFGGNSLGSNTLYTYLYYLSEVV